MRASATYCPVGQSLIYCQPDSPRGGKENAIRKSCFPFYPIFTFLKLDLLWLSLRVLGTMALVLHLLLSSRSCQRAAHKSWQQFNPMTALGFCRFWSKLAKILSNFAEIWRRMGSCYTAVRKLPVRWSQREKILQKVSTRVWMWTLWSDHDNDVTVQMCTVTSLSWSWSHHQSSQGSGNCWQGREAPGYDSLPLCHAHNTHLKEILTNLKKVVF